MANLNTSETENYSQLETRILGAIPLMSPENQRILVDFAMAMVGTQPAISQYEALTPTQRKMELIDVLARMKSHSITLSQFFCRLSTKRNAMEAMEREIANFQKLVALVRLDVMREIEEMEGQQ